MRAYCKKCNYEFEYTPKNKSELNKTNCPKCNKIVLKSDRRPNIYTEKDEKIDSILLKILNYLRFFYLVLSCIGIIGYYNNNIKLLIICASICIILYIIERIIGINYLAYLFAFIAVAIIISTFIIENVKIGIFFGICCGFIISTLIRELYFLLIDLIIIISSKRG